MTPIITLASRLDQLIRDGEVTDQAELARLGHVTRARLTQIMNLLSLAPDIQEQILFLPILEAATRAVVIAAKEIEKDHPSHGKAIRAVIPCKTIETALATAAVATLTQGNAAARAAFEHLASQRPTIPPSRVAAPTL